MHLTCKLLPLIASYLVLLSHLHHALDVQVASLSTNTGNKTQKLTLRTNVRVASHQLSTDFI